MKHWQEMGHIAERVLRLDREGRRAALAIVTRIEGSSYRRPGAKLLVQDEGDTLGGVSGGCLEQDVRHVGMQVSQRGHTRTLHYDTYEDDSKVWGFGLGCDGKIDILVVPAAGPGVHALETWSAIRDRLAGDSAFAVSLAVEDVGRAGLMVMGPAGRVAGTFGDPALDSAVEAAAAADIAARRSSLAERGGRLVFTEVLTPPPKLLVCGAGDDACPIARLGAEVGFRVLVADHRPAYLTRERFPSAQRLLELRPDAASFDLALDRDTYAVVKTHALQRDTAWVRRLTNAGVPYVGVLGPKTRIQKIMRECGASQAARIFGPVGLDLGADGPEQVALSVVSEVLAVVSGRNARHLREREGSLHAPA